MFIQMRSSMIVALIVLLGVRGQWQRCPAPRSSHVWRGTGSDFTTATARSVVQMLGFLPQHHIMFWGDSTDRQLYLDFGLLATMRNNSFDDVCDKNKWRDVYWHKADPRLPSETVVFDDYDVKCTRECGKDCLIRQWRYFTVELGASTGTISHYGAGRLHCPLTDEKSLDGALKSKGCPDVIVTGSDLWPCRWGWKGYNHSNEIKAAAQMIEDRCPRAIKIWKTANFVDPKFPFIGCVESSRQLAAHMVPSSWHVVDTWPITADPILPTHGRNRVPTSMMAGGRHMSPIGVRAVSSALLTTIMSAVGGGGRNQG